MNPRTSKSNEDNVLSVSYVSRSAHRRSPSLAMHTSVMDPESLVRINAHEDRLFPVELKVKMLMEQASMRMRASAMVGERISLLDDVIRVRALMEIVRHRSDADEASEATRGTRRCSTGSCDSSSSDALCPATRTPPTKEELVMYTRMAVAALKTVLFQLVDEGAADSSKDLSQLYDGLVSTDELSLDASEGFPTLDVDSLLSREHLRYRKLVTSRHRFLVSSGIFSLAPASITRIPGRPGMHLKVGVDDGLRIVTRQNTGQKMSFFAL